MSKANEMIDRYVYDVTRRLPEAQRADIEKELRTLIDDMLGGREDVKDVTLVLIELGPPSELAAKYRGTKRYLIGPDLYGTYETILKIVLAAVAFGMVVSQIVINITTPPQSVFVAVGKALGLVIMGLVQAFAFVTLIFAINERLGKSFSLKDDWHPRDLPEVPTGSAVIKKSEPIAALVFSVIFLIIITTMPWLFGVGFGLPEPFIPVFNLEALSGMIGLIVLMVCAGIIKEVLRLVIGRYNVRLAIYVAVLNVISLALTITVFGSPEVWNANFLTQMQAATGAQWFLSDTALVIWHLVPTLIVVLTAIGIVTETATIFYRGFKHDTKRAAVA